MGDFATKPPIQKEDICISYQVVKMIIGIIPEDFRKKRKWATPGKAAHWRDIECPFTLSRWLM